MGELINGWKITKTIRAGCAQHWISKNGHEVGRAVKYGREWVALNQQGNLIFKNQGIDVESKTLDGLVMALADAEVSIEAERANRARQDQRKSMADK